VPQTPEQGTRSILHRFATYGVFAGLVIGLLCGVLVSGPHFQDWTLTKCLWMIFGWGVGGAVGG